MPKIYLVVLQVLLGIAVSASYGLLFYNIMYYIICFLKKRLYKHRVKNDTLREITNGNLSKLGTVTKESLGIDTITKRLLATGKKLRFIRFDKKTKTYIYIDRKICVAGALLCIIIFIIHGYINMNAIEKTTYTAETSKKFTIEEDGCYRVALLADIHYGLTMKEDNMRSLVHTLNQQNIDIVVLCGDVVDENSDLRDMELVFTYLRGIQSKYGTYFVYGNHDTQELICEEDRAFTKADLNKIMSRFGIHVLDDDIYRINEEFTIIGRADGENSIKRKSINSLTRTLEYNSYRLLLDHIPGNYDALIANQIDLSLSGHTHNGQLWPVNLFIKMSNEDGFMYGYREYKI